MKKIGFMFLSAIALSFTSACSKNTESSPAASPKKEPISRVDDLAGKSTIDVLQIKYRRADLKCRLFNRVGDKDFHLNLQEQPDDSFTWDLLHNFSNENTFSLLYETPDHQFISFELRVNNVGIQNLTYPDYETKLLAEMKNSPYVEYTYRLAARIPNPTGTITNIDQGGEFTESRRIHERVKDIPYRTGVSDPATGVHRAIYIDCTVDTETNSGYEDQYQTSRL